MLHRAGVRQRQNLDPGLPDVRLCQSRREAASGKPQKTTDDKGNFPRGSSETLPGHPTARSKTANKRLNHREPGPQDPAGCSSHTTPEAQDAFKVSRELRQKECTGQHRPCLLGRVAKVTGPAQETAYPQ